MAEVALRELVHRMGFERRGGIERVGDQHRVVEGRDRDAVVREDEPVVFHVLGDLEHAGLFEQRLQALQHRRRIELAGQRLRLGLRRVEEALLGLRVRRPRLQMAERDIGGFARRGGERDADEIRDPRIERRRLGIDRDVADLPGSQDHRVERLERRDRAVAGMVEGQRPDLRRPCGGKRLRPGHRRQCGRDPIGVARVGLGVIRRRQRHDAARLLDRRRGGAVARPPAAGTDEGRIGFRRVDVGAVELGDTPRQRREFERLQEAHELAALDPRQAQRVERHREVHVVDEPHEIARDADALDVLGQRQCLAPLRLLDLGGAGQQRVEVTVFPDELRRGLDADAGGARHVVGRVARERLHVDDAVRADAEIGPHFVDADPPLLARARGAGDARRGVVHGDAVAHELHQVLVGRDDQHVGAGSPRLARIGGDEVVGLVSVLLDRHGAEGTHGLAHQRKLRDQVLGGLVPVRLVGRVELLPERLLALVEDDRDMGRHRPHGAVAHELKHLRREQAHRAGRQFVGAVIVFLVLADRLEIGAKDEVRRVDEEDVVAGGDGAVMGHGLDGSGS